jgi:hypothetical protein
MMKRSEFETALVLVLLACSALSCATNSGDDSSAAGSSSANAGATASGGAPSSSAGQPPTGTAGSDSSAGSSPVGSAGSSPGGAGAPETGACATVVPADVVSDFESGKADVLAVGGRGGSWFLFDDGTGMQTPVKTLNVTLVAESGGACNSLFAFHSTGSGFTVFGAGFGADFAPKPAGAMVSTVYDASAYSGVAMFAKAATPIALRVSVSDHGTAPEGMVCVDTTDKTNKMRCGDYFGSDIMIGTDWQDFSMPFAKMTQRGFGLPVATGIDKSKVYTIRAQIKGSAAAPGAYDIWIDDVRFVK